MRGQNFLGHGIRLFLSSAIVCACAITVLMVKGAAAPSPFTVLHSFAGGANDGAMPTYGTSLAASGSVLYCVTQSGGVTTNGVLFKVNSNGSGYGILHQFNGYTLFLNSSGSKNDGAIPTGTPVIVGSTLFGMTTQGGSNGFGTIYKINTDGNGFQVLHHFGNQNDGTFPSGSLALSGTTLYGMTPSGGSNFSQGTIFKIETNGDGYQVLHNFSAQNGGLDSLGSVVVSDTTLYGMTRFAGALGVGVIFKVNTDGGGFQVLHTFTGTSTDGSHPYDSLMLAGSTLYGTTANGGANNAGTVFRIETDGTGFQLLHNFALSEGYAPYGNVTLVGSELYGMTHSGGSNSLGGGVLFKVTTNGSNYAVLHVFKFPIVANDGIFPFGSVLHSNSVLYGMTTLGGTKNQGIVFSYKLGAGSTVPGTPVLAGAFSTLKEVCKTRRGVLGCVFSAALTIQNTGTAVSLPDNLRYFFSTDDKFDPGVDVQFGTKKLGKIKAAKSKKLRLKAKTTESTAGRYLLAVNDAGTVLASTLISVP